MVYLPVPLLHSSTKTGLLNSSNNSTAHSNNEQQKYILIQLAHLYIPYISSILRSTFSILILLKSGCSNRLLYFDRVFTFSIVYKIMAYHNWWHCRVVEIWYMIETKVLQNNVYPLLWVMLSSFLFYFIKKKMLVITHQNEFIIHLWICGKLLRTECHTIGLKTKTNCIFYNVTVCININFKKFAQEKLQIT